MTTTTQENRLTEAAARLRMAIVRTAQEAAPGGGRSGGTELSPTAAAALATVERHGPLTPSELAEIERIKRPTGDPDPAAAGGGGPRRPNPRPGRRPQRPGQHQRRGPRAAAPSARPQERLPGAPDAGPARRGRRDARARRGDPRGDPRGAARAAPEDVRVSAALRRSVDSLSVPNYRRYFAGQVVSLSGNWMQMVAEIWLVLSLTGSGLAVGMTTALQFLPILLFGAWGGLLADRFPKRRLLMVTQALMAIPALALFGVTVAGVVAPWMVFVARLRPRHGQRRRQPDPAELRDRDGRRRPGRQRGQPQQRPDPLRAAGRPGDGRHPDRLVGVEPCFAINALSFGGMIFALWRMEPDAAQLGSAGRARAGRDPRRGALRPGHPRAGGAAGADGPGRDLRPQLPGDPAAAGPLQLRRRRRPPTRPSSRRWAPARSSARWRPAPTAAPTPA